MAYSRQLTEKALLFRNHNKRAKIILNIEIVRFRAGLETPLLSPLDVYMVKVKMLLVL